MTLKENLQHSVMLSKLRASDIPDDATKIKVIRDSDNESFEVARCRGYYGMVTKWRYYYTVSNPTHFLHGQKVCVLLSDVRHLIRNA